MNLSVDGFKPEAKAATAAELAVLAQLAGISGVSFQATPPCDWQAIWQISSTVYNAIAQGDRDTLDATDKVLRAAGCDTTLCQDMLQSATVKDLQDRYGGFAPSAAPLTIDGAFDASHLDALLSHRVNLIRVTNYAAASDCATLADRLADLPTTVWTYGDDKTRKPTDVMTVGVPAQTATSDTARQRYRDQEFEILRRLSAPTLSPLDRFRLDLDAVSTTGATVQGGSDGQRRLAGIVRIYRPQNDDICAADGQTVSKRGQDGYLHIDHLQQRDAAMYSYNIYLDVPDSGGELSLYNIAAPVFDESRPLQIFIAFLRNFKPFAGMLASLDTVNPSDAQVTAEMVAALPDPVVIRPAPGDLILINPGVPHAVRDLPSGRRVSVQGFLKVASEKPIRLVA